MEDAVKTEMPEKRRRTGRERAELAIRIALAAAAAAVYALYAIKNRGFAPDDHAAALIALAAFVLAVMPAVPGLVNALSGDSEKLLAYSTRKRRNFLLICLGGLLIHIAMCALGTVIFSRVYSVQGSPFGIFRAAWMKENTDAQHYLNIAENWYVNEGDDRLLLVFFPMLPVLIRALNHIVHNSFVSGQIINAAAASLACGMTYLTLTPVIGEKRGRLGAFAALLLPGMIFMNSTMSEPLFLLFSVCCFYFLQRRSLITAGVFAALAGFTRSLGVLLAVPIAIEGICWIVRLVKNRKNFYAVLGRLILALVISCLGTLAYLYINYRVSGEWLKFLEYQQLNWHQSFCPFFDTVRYCKSYLIQGIQLNIPENVVIFSTNIAAIFISLALIGFNAKRLPATYNFYFFAYFIVAAGCTWLLSGVRYFSAALPVTAAIALGFDKKWKTVLIFLALIALYAAYMFCYMNRLGTY